MTYQIEVTDAQDKGLKVISKKDGITVEELLQKQMDYYLGTVIKNYIEEPVELTEEKRIELNALLATTKAEFIATAVAEIVKS